VCDRYTLDSAVHLQHRYGAAGAFALQVGLIRMLSPRPRLAYLLDVAPEAALARKPDQFDIDELRTQAALYRAWHGRLGVRRLDGEAPPEEVCAQIARQVWEVVRDPD
jgi:thymidylate kinase